MEFTRDWITFNREYYLKHACCLRLKQNKALSILLLKNYWSNKTNTLILVLVKRVFYLYKTLTESVILTYITVVLYREEFLEQVPSSMYIVEMNIHRHKQKQRPHPLTSFYWNMWVIIWSSAIIVLNQKEFSSVVHIE